jgi:hypothetical protein
MLRSEAVHLLEEFEKKKKKPPLDAPFVGLAYQGEDVAFRFII